MRGIRLLEDVEGGYGTVFKKGEIYPEDGVDQCFNEDGTFTICQGMGMYFDVEKEQYDEVVSWGNQRWYPVKALRGNLTCLKLVNEIESMLEETLSPTSIASRIYERYIISERDETDKGDKK